MHTGTTFYANLLIIGLLALFIHNLLRIPFMPIQEPLSGQACTIPASGPSACQSVTLHQNTLAVQHTQDQVAQVKQSVNKQLASVTSLIDQQKGDVKSNSQEIIQHMKDIAAMNAAVKKPKKKKK